MEKKQTNILKNNSNDQLNDDNYERILQTIFESKKIEVDIRKSIFADDKKRMSCDLSQNFTLDCLKIEDRNYDDIFIMQQKYEKILKKWTNLQNTTKVCSQLNNCNLNDFMNGENNPCIAALCSIENMVESTYGYRKDFKYSIAEEICYMKLLAHKWRSIKGDGNCYYRSVIFSYLENLIKQKDIFNLQRIMIDFDEKFDSLYKNTTCLPYDIKDLLVKLDRSLVMTILKIIIELLDVPNKYDVVQKALIVLVKAFNFSKTFDTAMIMYFRYILYEYILNNKNKFFSEDFPVKIGNLLPYQYETEAGDFLFDKFFHEELLRFYTYAEKIAIYLTPFVLKVDLNIIFYDFGNECNIQIKNFSSYLKDKSTITILYRKAHYDVAYHKENCSNEFSYFKHNDDKLKIVDQKLIEYYEKNEMQKVNVKESKIFSKKEKMMRNKDIKMKPSVSTRSNGMDTTAMTNLSIDTTNSEEKPNIIRSDNVSREEIEGEYFKNNENNNIVSTKRLNPPYNDNIHGKENENNDIFTITDEEIKSKLCIECVEEKDCKSLKSYKLPCGCYLCGKACIEKYSSLLFKHCRINKIECNLK